MTTSRRYSLSETRIEQHLSLLEQLETLPLADSCCDICHCDCYNSHRSEDECRNNNDNIIKDSGDDSKKSVDELEEKVANTKIRKKHRASVSQLRATKVKKLSNESTLPKEISRIKKIKDCKDLRNGRKTRKRSKSVCLQRSQSQCSERYYTRDCEILHDIFSALDNKYLPGLEVVGKSAETKQEIDQSCTVNNMLRTSKTPTPIGEHLFSYVKGRDSSFAPIRLSESMANLCLAPTINEAYSQVPDHDKRILNRMATKRSEQALAKENAWLARKYWENERYERELLKCEQMEEYKKAVHDKQFQDFLHTKARLNEIAQRDMAELQRLKESLQQKDERTKKRLQCLRIERDLAVNQKRCEELRKMENVNLHQEEQNLDDMLRKSETCQRLTERLKRADHIRSKMLENYLKRLRYDNYIEQLQHEEHFREVQLNEKLKREQLKEQICRKRCRSQHFVETKLQRNESIRKTAKLSKSLRDLVRSSVTPENGPTTFGTGTTNTVARTAQTTLCKLLRDRPF